MRICVRRCVCAGFLLVFAGGPATTQPGVEGARPTARSVNDLDPAEVMGYLFVGESIARDPGQRTLAIETLAVGALLSERSGQGSLAASMVVAIAALVEDHASRRGLWMLAISLDADRTEAFRWLAETAVRQDSQAGAAARVLGLLRRNDPDGLREMTEDVRARVVREAEVLGFDADRVLLILRKWQNDAENDPCRGKLFVRVREGGEIVASACPLPGFHHGSVYNEDWAMMVAIELSLAGHTPGSWAVRGSIGLDRPVPVWTLDRLSETFKVSAERPVHRGGRWVDQ